MAKPSSRGARPRPSGATRQRPQSQPRTRDKDAIAPQKLPRPRGQALARRLAEEVERLEAELAAARAALAELAAKAERDPLTDVLNRRGFERQLESSLSYVSRYDASAALIYIDLDAFKPVNDRHGHAAGDAVLKAAAGALVSIVRASDLVARLGGDEFAVLLWNIAPADARMKAVAIEDAVAAATQAAQPGVAVGASTGIAILTGDDVPADVLARADTAMYARKAERRGATR